MFMTTHYHLYSQHAIPDHLNERLRNLEIFEIKPYTFQHYVNDIVLPKRQSKFWQILSNDVRILAYF